MAAPIRARAVVTSGDKLKDDTVTLPDLQPHEILVRVHYAAFNPTDMLAFNLQAFGDGAVLGCDMAGEVEKVGPEVSKLAVGDRVATFIWGGERHGVGAYSQLCIGDERLAFKVPSNITLEQAATIPLAATTSFLALFSGDCLDLKPDSLKSPIMVLGGSSTVGAFANQIAASHSIKTVASSSPRNAESVSKDGCERVFSYQDPDMAKQVRDAFPDLNIIFDTIGSPASTASVAEILESRNGKLCTVRPGKTHTENLAGLAKISDVFVFTVFPKEHTYRGKAHWPINHANHALGKQFFEQLPELITSGKIKPRPVKSMGELSAESVLEAINLTGKGQVSNEKLCFTVPQDKQ